MPGTYQVWSATGRTPDARSVGNFSSSVTGISSGVTISLLKVAAHLVAPAFPDGGILRFDDRLQPIPLFRSCAPNQICLCSTSKKAKSVPGSQVSTLPRDSEQPSPSYPLLSANHTSCPPGP